ncbi:retrovirus-related pol polyprotein from transposon TNT 1-94 [Tanacetum coccineum]
MSRAIPPIPPPFWCMFWQSNSPNANRVDMMPTTIEPINTTTTTNVAQSVFDENLPQLLDSRGGFHVTNVYAFNKEDFTSWKVSIENPLPKRQNQWLNAENRLANQDKQLKTHEGLSDTRDTKIASLRLKFNAFKSLKGEKVMGTFIRLNCLLNDLKNNGVTIPQAEVNATSRRVESARKPIDKTKETCFACEKTSHFQKDLSSNKTSTPSYPSSNNSFNKFKSYTPPVNQTSSHNTDNYQKDYKGNYKGLKAEVDILTQRIDDLTKGKSEKGKNDKGNSEKGLIVELFDWDEESVSSDDEETTRIRAFIAIAEVEPSLGKADAKSGQWVDITMKKGLLKEEPGPKVVFGDDSLGETEGYGLVNCNGITFTRVSYVNGLSHNLISISQLCDANFKVLFTETQGTIFNQNDKVVLIAPRRRDVYIIDMSSFNKESNVCFLAKASLRIENLNEVRVKELRSDNGTEFRNHKLEEFCDEKGISHNFSSSYTPEQNGVAERRNKTLIEASRTMLNKGDAINFNENRSFLDDEFLEPRSKESVISEDPPKFTEADTHPAINKPDQAELVDHLDSVKLVNIIGEPLAGIITRSRIRDSNVASTSECLYVNFLSEMEPKKLIEAIEEEGWIIAMQEELKQFKRNKVWTLVPKPHGKTIIGTKWIWKNKMDENGIVIKNKARLVAHGFYGVPDGCNECILKWENLKGGDLLKKYNLADCALVKCPMLPPNNLGPDESGVSVNETLYQANLKESHIVAVKRIFRYLKGTLNIGLWYPKGPGFNLKADSDSDYAGSNLDRKSTSRAEYVAVVGCCAQVLWIKSQLAGYDVLYDKVSIFCDNTSAIAISNNPVLHSRTKHIDIRYHFIKDHILKGEIELHFVPTDLQLADIFTKPLAEPSFTRLVAELGMLNIEKKVSDKKQLSELQVP